MNNKTHLFWYTPQCTAMLWFIMETYLLPAMKGLGNYYTTYIIYAWLADVNNVHISKAICTALIKLQPRGGRSVSLERGLSPWCILHSRDITAGRGENALACKCTSAIIYEKEGGVAGMHFALSQVCIRRTKKAISRSPHQILVL